jgi:hypothetical protein
VTEERANYLDLWWLPVGAGTHFQRASLALYEAVAAALARRPRAALYHSALKGALDSRPFTLELMPIPARPQAPPVVSGPVGWRPAGRLRIFRYQLAITAGVALPDEEYAPGPPLTLTTVPRDVGRVLEIAPSLPAHTWGRKLRGTSEMWNSNSAVAWLLARAGLRPETIHVPAGGRAPGWRAGLQLASATPSA